MPLGAQEVVLEGRRYPYEGSYRVIARATTDVDGKFSFSPELDRNHRLRVSAPAQSLVSDVERAYTLPDFELSFRALRPGVVRLYQRYTVPKTVRLSAPTLFYLGPRGAKRASKRVVAELKRTSAGRYTSQATVRLPSRLARRLPLRELLPPLGGLRDGRSQRDVPAPAARVLNRISATAAFEGDRSRAGSVH